MSIAVKICGLKTRETLEAAVQAGAGATPPSVRRVGGFVYYVSVTGITGGKSAAQAEIRRALDSVRQHTTLPVAVGFGIRTPEQAAEFATIADAAVVGSAIVETIAGSLDEADTRLVSRVAEQITALAAAVHGARGQTRAGART